MLARFGLLLRPGGWWRLGFALYGHLCYRGGGRLSQLLQLPFFVLRCRYNFCSCFFLAGLDPFVRFLKFVDTGLFMLVDAETLAAEAAGFYAFHALVFGVKAHVTLWHEMI